ncbi:MAG TPA: family 1 glycosylhydrolase, partial [Puia sp.]|nr:family 1 glycosylhydrolase [Puia sp.]
MIVSKSENGRPQLWGGIECTINRVGNEYKDQLAYSGHYERKDDIEHFASLGIKAIRYPILWEKHEPQYQQKIDWRWTDGQLKIIQDNGMIPIAGLLHHGSGPLFTNLLDPSFPQLLAEYAYRVARRFPWLQYYTPVNEPLTTARFSGLYGHWYPHHKNDLSFYRMLLNQLKGTVLAMEAIRSVNPGARLIQTEDLGKTHSTPALVHQAAFENERRWLTFDLLSGKLNSKDNQYQYMLGAGIHEDDLEFFCNQQVRPDILGLNYYVTSERWLDESVQKYSAETIGANGAQV